MDTDAQPDEPELRIFHLPGVLKCSFRQPYISFLAYSMIGYGGLQRLESTEVAFRLALVAAA